MNDVHECNSRREAGIYTSAWPSGASHKQQGFEMSVAGHFGTEEGKEGRKEGKDKTYNV